MKRKTRDWNVNKKSDEVQEFYLVDTMDKEPLSKWGSDNEGEVMMG